LPEIKANGINIYYEVHGEGFPLVLIMGLSGNIDWWTPHLIEQMSSKFKTIIFDNRGTGRTDKPDTEYTIKLMADDAMGLMDALKIQKAHVAGFSMGGMIAQEVVLNYPARVEKLILACTHCGYGSPQAFSSELIELGSKTEGLSPEDGVREIIPMCIAENFKRNNPDFVEEHIQRILKIPTPRDTTTRQVDAIMNWNACRKIKKIATPTLIVHGKEDRLIPFLNADFLAKKIPGAKKVILENSGHLFFGDEDKLLQTMIEFLKS
jgi:3-oxoadipate enol-lactonase